MYSPMPTNFGWYFPSGFLQPITLYFTLPRSVAISKQKKTENKMESPQSPSSNDASSKDREFKLVNIVNYLPKIHSNNIIFSLM